MLLLAEAYLHRLDPFVIQFPDGWPLGGLRWYGMAYLAGFLVAWLIVRWLARTHRTAIPAMTVADLMIYILIGVLVGGRLGYCIFYDPALLVTFDPQFPFWNLLAINKGGMASHGGMIGVIAACWTFAVRNHLSRLHLLDVAALVSPPGLFFGRLANFINGELWGRALPGPDQADPPWWSIKYPQEIEAWSAGRLADLGGVVDSAGVSLVEWQSALQRLATDPDAQALVARTTRSLVAAIQDGNQAVTEAVRPLLTAFYPSQILQAITDGPLLAALLVLVWWKPRKPGVVGASFLMGYGLMRVISELFRQPDEGVSVLATPLGDLSRGQLLSVAMIAAGAVALLICSRREVEPVGGLEKGADA